MLKFWLRSPLMDAAGEADGGGSGAGAGKGGTPGFDPAAFKTEILTEFTKALNTTLNGFGKTIRTDFSKAIAEAVKPAPGAASGGSGDGGAGSGDGSGGSGDGSGAGAGAGAGAGSGGNFVQDARAKALERQMQSLQAKVDAAEAKASEAEKKQRDAAAESAVQKALGGFRFADEQAAKDAFEIHRAQVKWTDDGRLVGPDDTPVEEFVKASMGLKKYLLAPVDTTGAGARNGGGHQGRNQFSMEDLDPEKWARLKPEEKKAAFAAVGTAFADAQLGR